MVASTFQWVSEGYWWVPLKKSLPQDRQAQCLQSLLQVLRFNSWSSSRPSDFFEPVYQQYFSVGLVVDRVCLTRDWQVLSGGEESFPSAYGPGSCWYNPVSLPFIVASEHWGLMLSSAHLNPKVLVIQPVNPQPVMQNLVPIKFHQVVPAYAWSCLDGSSALEQVACITHLAMAKLCKGPLCVFCMDVKQSMSQETPLIVSCRAQTNYPFPWTCSSFSPV